MSRIMDKSDIQKLRELPIESVAERLGLRVSHHKALCPFHEDKHASLTFNVGRNTFRCYVDGAHGGPIDLAMQVLGKSFVETCKWLASENNIILTEWKPADKPVVKKEFDAARYGRFFERPILNDAARKFLFDERHLDPRVVNWCRLTSWRDKEGTNWLQIPYYDMEGKLTGVQGRNLDYRKDLATTNQPRFRFPQGSQCHIYNLPVLKLLKPGEPLFVTEGCSDCWSMLSSGHKAIAVPSATLLKPEDLLPLKGMSLTLHVFPDQDTPGEMLYRKLVEAATELGACIVRHQLPPDCKDYSEYYLKNLKT